MTNFTIYFEEDIDEEYDLIVEAKSIESIKKQWGEINSAVDYYCSNDEPADDMDEDGTIEDTDIKVVFDTQENTDSLTGDYEIVSVRKVDENE